MVFDQNSLGGVGPRSASPRPAPPPPPRPAAPKAPVAPGAPAQPGGQSALRVSLMPTELAGREGPNLGRRLAIFALVLIVLTLVIGGFNFYLSSEIAKKSDEREQLWKKVDALAETLKTGKAASTEAVDFERQAKVAAETLDAHLYWTSFFDFLESITKATTIYEKFSGDAENSLFTVDVIAKSYRDMAEQMVIMQEQPMIASVKVSGASEKIGQTGTVEGIFFSLVAKVKPDVWKRPAAAATK